MRTLSLIAVALLLLPGAQPGISAEKPDAVPPPVAGEVPSGEYKLDPSHASLLFRVDHLGFSMYTGRFTRFDARLQFDPGNVAASKVEVTIDPRSIDADGAPEGFMDTLRGSQWLDANQFPNMSFRSTRVEVLSPGKMRVHGELSLRGVTRPVTLDATYNGGYAGHPMDPNARIGFSARGTLQRSQLGISYGLPAPGSKFGVSDEVEIIVEAEFTGPPLKRDSNSMQAPSS